ncbi:MAG TPA: TIGR03619 family F420-dependent LLM class oxidoreductase [Actinomycetota bacterium]
MRLGLALPHYDFSFADGRPVTWERLRSWGTAAEEMGFDSIWISDHFFLSLARYGGRDEPFGTPEALTALAALATTTDRVRLGTLVLSAGFRHPAIVAKAAAVIDLLSGGRFDLGIGAGWYEDEYRAFGYDYEDARGRFDVLQESLIVLGELLGDGPATWRGDRFSLDGAYNRPAPVQRPRPPIWIGGKGGPRLQRLVARHGDGWNSVWAWSPQRYRGKVDELRATCEREGRDPASVRLSVGLYLAIGRDERGVRDVLERYAERVPGGVPASEDPAEWRSERLAGTPPEVLERLGAFAELGVEEVIVSPASVPFAVHDEDALALFAEAVVPAARDL